MKLSVKTCEIFPLMGIHSQDTKHAGAWRLHVLAATLDHTAECDHANGICKGGSGKIERTALEAAAGELGVKRSTFYYWLADARAAGILQGQGRYLYLASQEKLSQIFLCNSIDKSKAIIPLKLLFKPGWKSVVWAAYLKANHHKNIGYSTKDGKPVYRGNVIASKTLENITGISPRQQRRYKTLIRSKRNIAITTIEGSWETANTLNQAAQDQGKDRHYFTFNDPQQKDTKGFRDYRRVIAHTIPSRRTIEDKHAAIGAHGRRRQIDAAIKKGLRLVIVCNYPDYHARPQQANGQPSNRETFTRYGRRYLWDLPKSRKAPRLADESFLLRRFAKSGMGIWDSQE
jgi:hypothetical protein